MPSAWSEEIHVRYDPVLPYFSVFCGVVVFDGFGDIRKSLQQEKGINMNTFSGMLEVWGMVFRFENKKLSIMLLTSAYGGAVLAIVILILTHWGQSQGCVFPINDRTMR